MVYCVVCAILIGVCLVVWWLRGLVFGTEWWAGVTAVVGLGVDVAVGVYWFGGRGKQGTGFSSVIVIGQVLRGGCLLQQIGG